MEGSKEFQGKDLDAAIREACDYYNAPREKLEIEIIQDAKSGIFGIVGARKAKILARRAHLRETVEDILGLTNSEGMDRGSRDSKKGSQASQESSSTAVSRQETCVLDTANDKVSSGEFTPVALVEQEKQDQTDRFVHDALRDARFNRQEKAQTTANKRIAVAQPITADATQELCPRELSATLREGAVEKNDIPSGAYAYCDRRRPTRLQNDAMEGTPRSKDAHGETDEAVQEGFRHVPLSELDGEKLQAVTMGAMRRLISPLADDICLHVELLDNRVNVMVDCGDSSGLLIGREGQTLAALQYLVSRIVSRQMDAAVRVHLDTGAYRQRQDEKLREMALALAERVRTSGRSCSTRPLSSYHRRIVHMALQNMEDIQTRSSGDGAMKRVVILQRR